MGGAQSVPVHDVLLVSFHLDACAWVRKPVQRLLPDQFVHALRGGGVASNLGLYLHHLVFLY